MDEAWMRRALALAARGQGSVEPNPMVGCTIVRDAQLIGEGYHRRFGGPHAERDALANVTSPGALAGATWYVTLEPCCHTGKTPPCTEAILAARPARVVVAMADPFPHVAGGGLQQLRSAGIEVALGVCEKEARELNAPYLKRLATGRPWVIAKWAMTLDGRIATVAGDSQWITCEASRLRVHQLRGRVDAVIVGAGTAAADNPRLTARPTGPRQPVRIVFARRGALSPESQLAQTAQQIPVRLFVAADADRRACERLRDLGVDVVSLATEDGVAMVDEALLHCGRAGMTNVLVEGGGGLLGSFFDARQIDEYHVFLAAKVVGGREAPGPIGGRGIALLSDGPEFAPPTVERIEDDVLITVRRQQDGRESAV